MTTENAVTPARETVAVDKVTNVETGAKALLGLLESSRQAESPKPQGQGKALSAANKEAPVKKVVAETPAEETPAKEPPAEETPETPPVKETPPAKPAEEGADSEETIALPRTITEMAELLKMDADTLRQSLRDTIVVDGETQELPLHEIRRGHLREADYTRKTTELAEQRRAFEAERHAKISEVGERAQQLQALTQELEKQLTQEIKAVEWDKLKDEDPVQYVRLKEEHRERREMLARALAENQKVQEERAREFQGQFGQYLVEQRKQLLTHLPEWADADKGVVEQKKLASYLLSQGFQQNEVDAVYDHRLVLLVRKAMLHDQSQKEADQRAAVAKKKVALVPKMQAPGAKESGNRQQEEREQLMKRLKRTGRVDDASSLLLSMLKR